MLRRIRIRWYYWRLRRAMRPGLQKAATEIAAFTKWIEMWGRQASLPPNTDYVDRD